MHKITIVNTSQYRTDDLRRFTTAFMRRYWGKYSQPSMISILYQDRRIRDGWCGGYAYFNTGKITIKLPWDPSGHAIVSTDDLAMKIGRVLTHELYHCRGIRHRDMPSDASHDMEWLRGVVIRKKAGKPVKQKPGIPEKVAKLEARRKRWESKLKRAERAIRKIDKSVAYYRKSVERAGGNPRP